jgi:hypothetical protein
VRRAGLASPDVTRRAVVTTALGAALLAGAGAAAAPPRLTLAAILAIAVIAAVALHPPVAAYLLLATTPMLAGLERGLVLPVLRPHEAIALLVAAGLLVHLALWSAAHYPVRLRLSFGPIDRAMLLLAVTGSVVPLVVMVVRERQITLDDLLYALQLWKYYAIFVVIRACILTPEQVRRCLWIALVANTVVALVGIMQVLHVPFVEGQVTHFYTPEESNQRLERGTSTLASSIAVGDVMVFSLAIASGLLLYGDRRRFLLAALSALFVFGTVATGQFSAIIALVIGVLAFGWITGRFSMSIVAFTPVVGIGALALRPVVEARLRGFGGGSTLPASWQARLDNVTTYFWPVLKEDYNWLTGVRPLARVEGPRFSGIDFIWIESGHIWLLWTGGVACAAAFVWFLWVALRTVARLARERSDAVRVAAVASFTALAVNAVLMVLDPHLTLRGSADLSFALLALALAAPAVGAAQRP